jgi:UDP-N-acetylglucosamine/UDP-N-acetylgalactosamine 4-epimerase
MYDKKFHTKDLSSLSFLITGGAGFIGSNIVSYLLHHQAGKVVVLDNLSEGQYKNIELFSELPNFSYIQGDITDFATCLKASENIDYVIHQGALGSVPRSIKYPLATNAANVTGFLNVLEASRKNQVKRMVYASSSSVYGDSEILPKKEEIIGKPLSPYAVSKLVNEQYAAIYNRTYAMEVIGLRYFNIFGPNQKPDGAYAAVLPLFMKSILTNEAPYINGDGEQSRDFTFVANAVKANILALFTASTQAFGNVYNVAAGESYSVNQLFEMLKEISGSELKPIHREERAGDVRRSLADISKAKNDLGYEPEVYAKDGLKITFDWFKKTYQKG